jgi:hypothetical protein
MVYRRVLYLATKAISDGDNFFHAQILPQVLDRSLNDWIDTLHRVLGEPLWEIDLPSLIIAKEQGIAGKDIGNDCEVSIARKVIGKQLAVADDAKDVTEQDDGLFRSLTVLRICKVGSDCKGTRLV